MDKDIKIRTEEEFIEALTQCIRENDISHSDYEMVFGPLMEKLGMIGDSKEVGFVHSSDYIAREATRLFSKYNLVGKEEQLLPLLLILSNYLINGKEDEIMIMDNYVISSGTLFNDLDEFF